jgi:hypothetical protein
VEKYDTARQPQTTKWRMRFAFLIPMAADPHAEYVILFFYTATVLSRKRLIVTCIPTFSPVFPPNTPMGKMKSLYIRVYKEILGSIVLALTEESLYLMIHGMNIYFSYKIQIIALNSKRRLLYLKTQFIPRSKRFSSRL